MRGYLVLAALLCLAAAPARAAESSACQTTTDGNTVCSSDGSLSCQTINGKTTCITGKDGRAVEVNPGEQPDRPRPPRLRDRQVTVERDGKSIHIENGNVDIREN
jgi:hypothetical protein